jgi:hypothetical protein
MGKDGLAKWTRGATQLGFADVLTALLLLGLLLYAAYAQFPAYQSRTIPRAPASQGQPTQ